MASIHKARGQFVNIRRLFGRIPPLALFVRLKDEMAAIRGMAAMLRPTTALFPSFAGLPAATMAPACVRGLHGSSGAFALALKPRTIEEFDKRTRLPTSRPVRVGSRVAVVLREQLDNLGYKGEEVLVVPGYARNFLVPSGQAVYATQDNRTKYKVVLPADEAKAIAQQREVNMLRKRIAEVRLTFVQATSDGKTLFGSVTSADLVESLQNSHLRKLAIKEKGIRVPGAPEGERVVFKVTGEHDIEIEPRPGLWCAMKIEIMSS